MNGTFITDVLGTVFVAILFLIYVCNIAELIKYRIENKGDKKELLGIELVQIVLVSVYTSFLILKNIF